jgi:hypothetical protein
MSIISLCGCRNAFDGVLAKTAKRTRQAVERMGGGLGRLLSDNNASAVIDGSY